MSTELSNHNVEQSSNQLVNQQGTDKTPVSIGLPIFLMIIAMIVYGTYVAYQWLQDEQKLPVQEIVFSGDIQVIQTKDLEQLIRNELTSSFFALNVNDVHSLMEQQAWVYNASVRKRWPSKLYVHIVEQKAVARWNDDLLLNQYGDSFEGLIGLQNQNIDGAINQNRKKLVDSLPQLFGPGGSEKTALTGYTHMQGLLNSSRQEIKQLVLSERFAWQAIISSEQAPQGQQFQISLRLGRQDYINRLQRYIDVYPLMKQRVAEEGRLIDYVDLRYDTGLAVGWQDDKKISDNSQKSPQDTINGVFISEQKNKKRMEKNRV